MQPFCNDAFNWDITEAELYMFSPIGSKAIKLFLKNENTTRTILVAPKGYGKTLLLRKKAVSIRRAYPTSTIHPSDGQAQVERITAPGAVTTVLDFPDLFDKRTGKDPWEDLWLYAISATILEATNAKPRKHDREPEKMTRNDRDAAIYDELFEGNQSVGGNLAAIITKWPTMRETYGQVFARLMRPRLEALSVDVFLFLDAADEALTWAIDESNPPYYDLAFTYPNFWVEIQVALLTTVRRFHSINKRVNIFATLRSEALNTPTAPLQGQAESICLRLDYSEQDLIDIFCQNIELLPEDELVDAAAKDPIERFLGVSAILHEPTGKLESPIETILRHSMWRPRDVIEIGAALLDIPKAERKVERIRTAINEKSAWLYGHYQQQAIPLWEEAISDLVTECKSNVISRFELERLRRNFMARHGDRFGDPWQYLYSQGFLGYVGGRAGDHTRRMQFLRGPGMRAIRSKPLPPGHNYYVLHPCLVGQIRDRQGELFRPSTRTIVGYDKIFTPPAAVTVDLTSTAAQFNVFGERLSLRIEQTCGAMWALIAMAIVKTKALNPGMKELRDASSELCEKWPKFRSYLERAVIASERALEYADSSHTKKINKLLSDQLGSPGRGNRRKPYLQVRRKISSAFQINHFNADDFEIVSPS